MAHVKNSSAYKRYLEMVRSDLVLPTYDEHKKGEDIHLFVGEVYCRYEGCPATGVQMRSTNLRKHLRTHSDLKDHVARGHSGNRTMEDTMASIAFYEDIIQKSTKENPASCAPPMKKRKTSDEAGGGGAIGEQIFQKSEKQASKSANTDGSGDDGAHGNNGSEKQKGGVHDLTATKPVAQGDSGQKNGVIDNQAETMPVAQGGSAQKMGAIDNQTETMPVAEKTSDRKEEAGDEETAVNHDMDKNIG